jgi:hypothetical protein
MFKVGSKSCVDGLNGHRTSSDIHGNVVDLYGRADA